MRAPGDDSNVARCFNYAQRMRGCPDRTQGPPNSSRHRGDTAGTPAAIVRGMAAIFALVFVPAVAAVLCTVGDIHGHLTFTSVAAASVFIALLGGLLVGLFRLAHQWDEPTH